MINARAFGILPAQHDNIRIGTSPTSEARTRRWHLLWHLRTGRRESRLLRDKHKLSIRGFLIRVSIGIQRER